MAELKTTRPYRERFLDGFDRSQLRQEVQKVKPRFSKLQKKYVTWALGASLAVGSIGAPMKIIHDSQEKMEQTGRRAPKPADAKPASVADQGISGDRQMAQNIASQVAGGVAAAAKGVEQGVQQAAQVPLAAVAAVSALAGG